MPAFYRASLPVFLAASESELLGILTLAHAEEGFQQQLGDATITWSADIHNLRSSLEALLVSVPEAAHWTVLLEFVIPRKKRRIDVVLLAGGTIILIEQKSGKPSLDDCLQAEEYALLLHYFHRPSDQRRIVPLIVSPYHSADTAGRQQELAFKETAAYWIAPLMRVSWSQLSRVLESYALAM